MLPSIMFLSMMLPTQEFQILPVQRDCRVIDVVGTDVTLVVDDDAGLVYAASEAPLTQSADTLGVCVAAVRPGSG